MSGIDPRRGSVKFPVDDQQVLFKAWVYDDSTADTFEDDEPHADGNVQTHYMLISPPWAAALRGRGTRGLRLRELRQRCRVWRAPREASMRWG